MHILSLSHLHSKRGSGIKPPLILQHKPPPRHETPSPGTRPAGAFEHDQGATSPNPFHPHLHALEHSLHEGLQSLSVGLKAGVHSCLVSAHGMKVRQPQAMRTGVRVQVCRPARAPRWARAPALALRLPTPAHALTCRPCERTPAMCRQASVPMPPPSPPPPPPAGVDAA